MEKQLLACINFMNLSTARSEKRAKEVGIRKSVGALRNQVMKQFLNESVMVALISFLFALALVILALPYFNQLSDKQIVIHWNNPYLWMIAIGFTIFTGMIAGSYPVFYLSAFNPVKVLKGYTRNGLISVPFTDQVQPKYEALRTELLATGVVENVAASSQSATYFTNINSLNWPGKDPSLVKFFRDVNVTHDFGRTIQWTIKEGRDFSREHPSDSTAVIINESALQIMDFSQSTGQTINYRGKNFTVVGVVRDMITQSPYAPLEASISCAADGYEQLQ